ncbi:MAG: endopeptidase La [Clostridia bacterium]|nr:endopeptidase La [Clostridia bacterium]
MIHDHDTHAESIRLPMVALRGMVIYPETVVHFDAGREKSVASLNQALEGDSRLFVVAQKNAAVDDPKIQDLYPVGTIVKIKQIVRMPDGILRVLVEGISRAALVGMYDMGSMGTAEVFSLKEKNGFAGNEIKAFVRMVKHQFERLAHEKNEFSAELRQSVQGENDPGRLADLIASNVFEDIRDKQAALECTSVFERLHKVSEVMEDEIDITHLERDIQKRVHERIERNNREYYLREQMHVIEDELGEADEDIDNYNSKLNKSAISGEARERTEKEIKRLTRVGNNTPESAVLQSYIEYMLELPWGKYDPDEFSIQRARNVLENDHFGLDEVKKRILEFLAVRSIKKDAKGPILCLVGAPGVGKTSIARSVARALKRKFCQVSLGGVHDEAEIRGHRRTYVAAMPGRVISAIKQAGTMNPVFLFDEIDKMASDMRGDPAAAMLEVLDPEQNSAYRDHYLEAPFDLSGVFFITTANNADAIPKPLYDRMEVIEVPSYTLEEKVQIAKKHLWKKQLEENGLNGKMLRITDKAIAEVIDGYTREAGVRTLERKLGAICRKAVVERLDTAEEERKLVTVKPEMLKEYLGARRFSHASQEQGMEVGVVNGLAWTSVGGEVMPIEVSVLPGDGKLILTGSLGDVMKESAEIAWSYVRSKMEHDGITEDFRKKHDLHVHVPEGATPKDGPSAGIALACAIYSAVTGVKARQDIAMTGEISLRGKALPIGGVKEKLLAAYRAGIKLALVPNENEKDLETIPEEVKNAMSIRTISDAMEAFAAVLPENKTTAVVKAVV